jgi:hypothetical protein
LTLLFRPKSPERCWIGDSERKNAATRTVDVELWLHALNYTPGTRSKIRNIMFALFNHAMRYEWMDRNPITKVLTSAKRLREPMSLRPPSSQLCFPS